MPDDTLIPLELPPGLWDNGTVYQAKNRWHTGNFVRFFQMTIQPIGGWTKRTLTGATITGTPNAALGWQDNNGAKWIAIGTTAALYVIDSSNVVYDITPTTIDAAPYTWQLSLFGAYLVAVQQRAAFSDTSVMNWFVWLGDTGTPAACPVDDTLGPGSVYGCFTTAERYLMLLRGADTMSGGGYPIRPVGPPIISPISRPGTYY